MRRHPLVALVPISSYVLLYILWLSLPSYTGPCIYSPLVNRLAYGIAPPVEYSCQRSLRVMENVPDGVCEPSPIAVRYEATAFVYFPSSSMPYIVIVKDSFST